MTEDKTQKKPTPAEEAQEKEEAQTNLSADVNLEDQSVDPRDLVYKGGYTKDPQEIVEHPAVTPPVLDESRE